MSSFCQRCGKGKMRGNLVSHAKNRSHRVWKPNLQPVHVGGRKLWLCTKCVRIVRKQEREKKQ